jgi:hypothetical protein
MLEKLIVGLLVVAAFAYAAWALTPAAMRLQLARKLVASTGGAQAGGALARLAQRLEKAAGGGGHCSGCEVHSAKPTANSRQSK